MTQMRPWEMRAVCVALVALVGSMQPCGVASSFVTCLSAHRATYGCGIDPSGPSQSSCECLRDYPTSMLSGCIGVDAMLDLAELACQDDPRALQKVMRSLVMGGGSSASSSDSGGGAPQLTQATQPTPTAAGGCDPTTVADQTTKCVMADPVAVACVQGGGSNCQCLQHAAGVHRCLGSCWDMVERTLCQPDNGQGPVGNPPPTVDCDLSTVATRTQECITADADAVACIRAPEASQCGCLRGATGVQQCLGPCWNVVQSTICGGAPDAQSVPAPEPDSELCDPTKVTELTTHCISGDPTIVACLKSAGSDCECVTASASAESCLGACWSTVLAAVCPLGADPSAQTAAGAGIDDAGVADPVDPVDWSDETPPSASDMPGTEDLHDPPEHEFDDPDAADPFDGGEPDPDDDPCTPSKVTPRMTRCIKSDPTALACIRGSTELGKCDCLRDSQKVIDCLEECWPVVEDTICNEFDLDSNGDNPDDGGVNMDSPPDPNICDESALLTTLQLCVAADAVATKCIQDGNGQCHCMRLGTTSQECLGPCWSRVEASICGGGDAVPHGRQQQRAAAQDESNIGAPPDANHVPFTEPAVHPSCDDSALPELAGTCVKLDPATIKCISEEQGSHCECFRKSVSVQNCLGNCWAATEASICSEAGTSSTPTLQTSSTLVADPTLVDNPCSPSAVKPMLEQCMQADDFVRECIQGGGETCHCMAGSATLHGCLGVCWPDVRAEACGVDILGSCNADTVGVLTRQCFKESPDAMQCLLDGREECACFQESGEVGRCVNDCAPFVERTLCGCTKAAVPGRLTACATNNSVLRACLVGPQSDCDCIRESIPLRACLGDCWAVATNEVCHQRYEEQQCNASALASTTRRCLGSGEYSDGLCKYLEANTTAKICFGSCWRHATDTLCDSSSVGCSVAHAALAVARCALETVDRPECFDDGASVPSRCDCLSISPSAARCLGPCFHTVRDRVCSAAAADSVLELDAEDLESTGLGESVEGDGDMGGDEGSPSESHADAEDFV